MNSSPSSLAFASPQNWSRRRWLWLVAFALAVHVALVFVFSSRHDAVPRPVVNVPQFHLAEAGNELIALTDPTLFVLPRLEDFASVNYLRPDIGPPPPFRWTEEPPQFLTLDQLPAGLDAELRQASAAPKSSLSLKPEPLANLLPVRYAPPLPVATTVQVSGDLASRLPAPIAAPSLNYNDVLRPSRVQVLVDEQGRVVSAVLLAPSGWPDADARALALARAARFTPATSVALGHVTFNWHTVPATPPPTTP